MKGLVVGALLAGAAALGASVWLTSNHLARLVAASAELEARSDETNQRYEEAVALLEMIARPSTSAVRPQEAPNPPVTLSPPFEVVDGDTFNHGGQSYQLAGIEAPGLRGPDSSCIAETYLGDRARDMVNEEVTREGARITITTFGTPPVRDGYDRILVELRVNGEDIGQKLVRNQLAVQQDRRFAWCGGR